MIYIYYIYIHVYKYYLNIYTVSENRPRQTPLLFYKWLIEEATAIFFIQQEPNLLLIEEATPT